MEEVVFSRGEGRGQDTLTDLFPSLPAQAYFLLLPDLVFKTVYIAMASLTCCDPPASVSQLLGSEACPTMASPPLAL